MFEKLAVIKSKTKLHKRSIIFCISNMLLGAVLLPVFVYLGASLIFKGNLPVVFQHGQFLLYFILVGRFWYTCYLRIWSHSYMLDFTQEILNPEIKYCPRCLSPIKVSEEEYTYEEVVGYKIIDTYYADGHVIRTKDAIKEKRKEFLPFFECKNKECGLCSKAQANSAKSDKVRRQVHDSYAFTEMPKTLDKTYRLIAGDRQDVYKERPVKHNFCLRPFWSFIVFFMVIFYFLLYSDDINVLSNLHFYLFGPDKAILLYVSMMVLLLVSFVVIYIVINKKTSEIMNSEEFTEINRFFDCLEYDIYLAKKLAVIKKKNRRKLLRQARKGDVNFNDDEHEPLNLSKAQWNERKKKYKEQLVSTISGIMTEQGYNISSSYFNQCYILHAYHHGEKQPAYTFFICKENCFLMGSTQIEYGIHRSYIDNVIEQVANNDRFKDMELYIAKDIHSIRLSFGLLASHKFEFSKGEEVELSYILKEYFDVINVIRQKTSSEVLENVPGEIFVSRPLEWNGFILE